MASSGKLWFYCAMEARSESSSRFAWVVWGGVFLVVYFLSTGPVIKYNLVPDGVGEVVYAPLIWTARIPFFGQLVGWYVVDVWKVSTHF